MQIKKICEFCKKPFFARSSLHIFCSEYCVKQKAYSKIRKTIEIQKICNCGKEFATFNKRKIYCSNDCNKKYTPKLSGGITEKLCTGTIGVIGELVISIDLLKKGYNVYRALSPSSNGDLIAEKNNIFCKIEVRTGRQRLLDNAYFFGKRKKDNAEIYAVVIHGHNKIFYCNKNNQEIQM